MFFDIAKVVYAARRAAGPVVVEGEEVVIAPAWDELASGDREPFIAEVRSYLEGGEPMQDAVGAAIVDALK